MKAVVVETVHNLDEFLSLISKDSRIHYELFWEPVETLRGLIMRVRAGIIFYGLTDEGFVLKCILAEEISWQDERLRKYGNIDLHQAYDKWIKDKWAEFEQKAKEIGATYGRFEMTVIA